MAARSIFKGDVNVVAPDFDGMGRRPARSPGRRAPDRSGRRTGRRASGAADLGPDQLPFGERAAVVGADVVDGVVPALDVENGDGPAVEVDQLLAARRESRRGRRL